MQRSNSIGPTNRVKIDTRNPVGEGVSKILLKFTTISQSAPDLSADDTAFSGQYSSTGELITDDSKLVQYSIKPKKKETPRSIKQRHEMKTRMKQLKTSADSGLCIESESDSYSSSGPESMNSNCLPPDGAFDSDELDQSRSSDGGSGSDNAKVKPKKSYNQNTNNSNNVIDDESEAPQGAKFKIELRKVGFPEDKEKKEEEQEETKRFSMKEELHSELLRKWNHEQDQKQVTKSHVPKETRKVQPPTQLSIPSVMPSSDWWKRQSEKEIPQDIADDTQSKSNISSVMLSSAKKVSSATPSSPSKNISVVIAQVEECKPESPTKSPQTPVWEKEANQKADELWEQRKKELLGTTKVTEVSPRVIPPPRKWQPSPLDHWKTAQPVKRQTTDSHTPPKTEAKIEIQLQKASPTQTQNIPETKSQLYEKPKESSAMAQIPTPNVVRTVEQTTTKQEHVQRMRKVTVERNGKLETFETDDPQKLLESLNLGQVASQLTSEQPTSDPDNSTVAKSVKPPELVSFIPNLPQGSTISVEKTHQRMQKSIVISKQMQRHTEDLGLQGEKRLPLTRGPVPPSPFSPEVLKSRLAATSPGSSRFELSDGEMTDATDITLDGMVHENQLRNLISSPETINFSDYDNMSDNRSSTSSNSEEDYDVDGKEKKKKGAVKKTVVKQIHQSEQRTQIQSSQSGSSTHQVVESYRKETSKEERQENRERKRSIKDMVKSFEGHAPSFMLNKPKSVEDLRRTPSEESLESDNDDLPSAEALRTSMKELSGSEPNLFQGPSQTQGRQSQGQGQPQRGRIQGRRGGLRKK